MDIRSGESEHQILTRDRRGAILRQQTCEIRTSLFGQRAVG